MPKPTGYVVYEGPSRLTGDPIVGIVTLHSDNVKTGDMPQLWIVPRDVSPVDAVRTGQDARVCGDCPPRGTGHGARPCYVKVWQSPRAIWAAYKRGKYPKATSWEVAEKCEGRPVRLGAYGEPSALPAYVSQDLVSHTSKHTGYTHQWDKGMHDTLRQVVMASVDTPDQALKALAGGWRTFRATLDDVILEHEILCPASKEAGAKVQCDRCGLCNGSHGPQDKRKSIVIKAHGSGAPAFAQLYQKGEV